MKKIGAPLNIITNFMITIKMQKKDRFQPLNDALNAN